MIKTMNSKMPKNSQLSTNESEKNKDKLNKQLEPEQNHINGAPRRVICREGEGREQGKGTGVKKHNLQVENRQGDIKNSIGNGEAKELICMTHGHELRVGDCWREGA